MKFFVHSIHCIFDMSRLPIRLKKVTKMGIRIFFVVLLLFTLLMTMYIDYQPSHLLFELCAMGIQSSSTLMVSFLVCSASFNRILKEKNG